MCNIAPRKMKSCEDISFLQAASYCPTFGEFWTSLATADTINHLYLRACMHDPDAYEDPFEFRPERFIRDGQLDPTVRDPVAFVFGFGRRQVLRIICPGLSTVNSTHSLSESVRDVTLRSTTFSPTLHRCFTYSILVHPLARMVSLSGSSQK